MSTAAVLRVLVVDDDFHIARLHSSIVDATPGFTVVSTVGTARGALSLIDAEQPDLIVLDAYLPDGSGVDLIRRTDADVIMVTAANDAETVRRTIRHGAFGYLIKPFSPELLVERLTAYSDFRRLLSGTAAIDQATIDRTRRVVSRTSAAKTRTATEQAVLDAVNSSDVELSAPEVAELIGVSRATAQRYLGALSNDRLVDVSLKYGNTGRPEHRYRSRRSAG
jgi:two-component system CitB family response regulator